MVYILNIYPNKSWYYSNFIGNTESPYFRSSSNLMNGGNTSISYFRSSSSSMTGGNTINQIKIFTLTDRIIGPISFNDYYLMIFYNHDKSLLKRYSKKHKNEINKYGQKVVKMLFRGDNKIFKIRGRISVTKFDFDNNLLDISFDDFYEIYNLYDHDEIKENVKKQKIKNFFSKIMKKLK